MASTYLLFPFLLVACHALKPNCPPPENISPACYCKDLGDGPMMLCSDVMNEEELIAPIKETQDYDMFTLSIHDSSLLYFPSHLFRNTHFKKIRLVGTRIMSLAETDLAFEGLEGSLEEFRVMEANYVTQWDWRHLANLQKISLIDIDLVSLETVDEPFPQLKSLTALALTRGDISFIVGTAFKDLENLRILSLKNNEISELSRSMFPNPAEQLMFFDLSNNKLNTLPSDIFEGMPSLSVLNLKNNEIKTLNEGVFSPVLNILEELLLEGNELRCDCRMRWIVGKQVPRLFDAVCSQPDALKGEQVKYLQLKHLWCY